jgi:hypothetical protein
VSDPTSQPPLPAQPPRRGQQPLPGQPPYYEQPPNQQPPPYYDQARHQQPPYYEQAPHQQQPQYGPPPPGFHGAPPPPRKSKLPWLVAAAIAVVVSLVGGAAVFVVNRTGGEDSAEPPVPTATFTDGLSSPEPSADPTDPPTTVPSPEPTPSPSPTPTERRRTLKDVDQGLLVYDDVYIKPASGWRKFHSSKYTITLVPPSRTGIVLVVVNPVGYPAAKTVPVIVRELVALDKLTGVQKGAVKTLSPANSNIASQAQISFTARLRQNGVSASLSARCTTMTGVESIHNVTVSVCVEARKDTAEAAFRDANRMLASVARSI